jgi:hypothetical protein
VTVGHSLVEGESTWGQILFDWINSTFPHPDHEGRMVPCRALSPFNAASFSNKA